MLAKYGKQIHFVTSILNIIRSIPEKNVGKNGLVPYKTADC